MLNQIRSRESEEVGAVAAMISFIIKDDGKEQLQCESDNAEIKATLNPIHPSVSVDFASEDK
jgi:hypothetical protein